MDKKKEEQLEKLFNKYGVEKRELVKLDKTFLNIESYKIKLNLNKTIYRDKLVKNGGNGSACVIIPLFENDDLLMVVQPRVFSKRGVLLDFPSGYIESGEDVTKAALRELEEETGYKANKMLHLASYYQDEGVSDSIVHLFLATELSKVKELNLDEDEYLEPIIVGFSDLDELIDKEYIKSGGSQLAISKIKLLRSEGKC